jgi:CubicO group peptidase (beta-lactamase class C family)
MLAYMNNGLSQGFQLLEPNTIELIKSIAYPNIDPIQGLIWYYKNENGQTLFGHNGGDIGSSTEMFISYSDDIGVIVLSNIDNYNAVLQAEAALFDFAEETTFSVLGDVNQDGHINVLDIIATVNIILSGGYDNLSDINADGLVNVLDVISLVNIILN